MKRLLSISICSGLLTLVKMASGFVIAKAVAIYAGPSGIALLGQFQSMVLALNSAVAAPVSNGLIRYTAEHTPAGQDAYLPWWRATSRWLLYLLAIVVPIGVVTAPQLAAWLLNDESLTWLIVVAVLTLPLSALFTLVTSVLNGRQQYKAYFTLSGLGVVASTILMIALVATGGIKGALLAAAVATGMSGVIVLAWIHREEWFRWRYWWGGVGPAQMNGVGKYVLMGLTSALFMPAALILVRKILVSNVGWDEAGHWQAVYKISEVYLGVITIAVSTYYLPRLASMTDKLAIRREIISTASIVMPFVIISAVIIYIARDIVIGLLFTEQFLAARNLFATQLLGDVFKVLGWLIAYTMWSRGSAVWFIASEAGFCIMFVTSAWFLVKGYGTDGANMAYAGSYLAYFLLMAVRFHREKF